jgi:hypothetical protein
MARNEAQFLRDLCDAAIQDSLVLELVLDIVLENASRRCPVRIAWFSRRSAIETEQTHERLFEKTDHRVRGRACCGFTSVTAAMSR